MIPWFLEIQLTRHNLSNHFRNGCKFLCFFLIQWNVYLLSFSLDITQKLISINCLWSIVFISRFYFYRSYSKMVRFWWSKTMIEAHLACSNYFRQVPVYYLIFTIYYSVLSQHLPILATCEVILQISVKHGIISGDMRDVLNSKFRF